jgi:hypothetical protein
VARKGGMQKRDPEAVHHIPANIVGFLVGKKSNIFILKQLSETLHA